MDWTQLAAEQGWQLDNQTLASRQLGAGILGRSSLAAHSAGQVTLNRRFPWPRRLANRLQKP